MKAFFHVLCDAIKDVLCQLWIDISKPFHKKKKKEYKYPFDESDFYNRD